MMSPADQKKLLIVGDDYDLRRLVKSSLDFVFPRANVSYCGTLRFGSPDGSLQNLSALIIIWKKNTLQDWKSLLEAKPPVNRSSESLICAISSQQGSSMLRRTAVIASALSREEALFLAEFGVSCVHPLSTKHSEWTQDCRRFAQRIRHLIHVEDSGGGTPAERSVRHFETVLSQWSHFTDQEKMMASDDLLRHLGDSARYCELMSRKALLETDYGAAEQWLRRSIERNPGYLVALQSLGDLLKARGQFANALEVYEKLRAISPNNPLRLEKIAECHLAMGQLQHSEHQYSRALSLDSVSNKTREELAQVKLALGDYESAKLLLEHCGSVSRVASYLNAYGIQLVRAGRYEESIEHYKKAQLVLPTNTNRHQILFNIGLAYAKWGRFSEARQYAQLALAREPNYEKAAQLLKTMDDRLTQ